MTSSRQVQEHATRILDEVERAVVGKRDALELVLHRPARRRARAARGLSRASRRPSPRARSRR